MDDAKGLLGTMLAAAACLGLFSCLPGRPKAQELSTVAAAVDYPKAQAFSLRGYARPEYLGTTTWRNTTQKGVVNPEQAAFDPFISWVIPVTDEPEGPVEEARLWLTLVIPGRNLKNGLDLPEDWFDGLRSGFDGRRAEAKVMVRAGDGRGSAWERAIADAMARHGIASHPLAPVLAWPPAGK